jgi:hypothetical protein
MASGSLHAELQGQHQRCCRGWAQRARNTGRAPPALELPAAVQLPGRGVAGLASEYVCRGRQQVQIGRDDF